MYLLPRLVGPQRAKELMFFGDAFAGGGRGTAGSGQPHGSGRGVGGPGQEWAGRLAAGPTRALVLTKQLVNASLDGDRATAFAAEAAAQEINMTTRDANEGVASFVERRSPEYRGR